MAGRIEITIMKTADTVCGAHRPVCRAQCAHTGQERLDFTRRSAEVATIGAAWSREWAHCPSLVQKSTNTWVDRK